MKGKGLANTRYVCIVELLPVIDSMVFLFVCMRDCTIAHDIYTTIYIRMCTCQLHRMKRFEYE